MTNKFSEYVIINACMFRNRKTAEKIMTVVMVIVVASMLVALIGTGFLK